MYLNMIQKTKDINQKTLLISKKLSNVLGKTCNEIQMC